MASERLERALDLTESMVLEEPKVEEEVAVEEPDTPKRWQCLGCTDVENQVLKALQEKGITDKIALAVVMGNIKQESKFILNICEGGVRTGYERCYRGGFGLIQWTTTGRYTGLGATARQHGLDPNTLDAQPKWMFNEREWREVEYRFKTPGQSMSYYMNAAYRWLGWGVHGARTHYSNQYMHYFHWV